MRDFPRTAIKVPNAPSVPAFVISCGKCGKTEKVSANNHSGSIPPERLNAIFRNKGWIIGKKPAGDVCPDCQTKKENNVVQLKKETPVSKPTIVAEPPRELNKEDRRLIFAKINDVYLDNAYSKGWDDHKVAVDLGVPRSWVACVREENFGPEGLSGEHIKIMEEAKVIAQKLNNEVNVLNGHLKEGEKFREGLLVAAKSLLEKLAKIEKLVG